MKADKNKKEDFNELESEALTKGDDREKAIEKKEGKILKFIKSLDHSRGKNIQRTSLLSKIKGFFSIDYEREEKTKKDKFFYKLKNWWPLSKISGRIFLIYAVVVVLGMILLAIPGVVNGGAHDFKWDFLTSLFTTSSAFSDTGINIANVSADYSFWGQLIIIILIELGGIGILTFKIVLYLALNKKISINDTNLAQTERGSTNLSSAVILIRDGFIWLTMVQIVAAAILFFAFYFTNPAMETDNLVNGVKGQLDTQSPYHDFAKSLWFAIFHSTSAVNNAGFDIVSGSSLQPYNQSGHHAYLIQIVFLLEWVIGGLGYPTFHDIKRKIKARRNGEYVKFSLFTKLNFVIYGFLFVAGPLAVFGFEYADRANSLVFNYYSYTDGNALGIPTNIEITEAKPIGAAIMDIFFNTTSTRNAGFSTVNINDFNAGSKSVMGILMFIGSAPSSTAGGIRTTTFAILLLANYAIVRDRSHTTVFKKRIPDATVKRAFGVLFLSTILVAVAIIIAYADSHNAFAITGENGHNHYVGDDSIIQLFVLVTSAFGTVGMNPFTAEQTYSLGALTKIVLIIVMFLGQLGISNTLLVFVKSSTKKQYGYLEEDVPIG